MHPESLAARATSLHARPAPADRELVISPALLLRAARKSWGIVLVAVILSLGLASLYTSQEKRIYQAVATVQLDPQALAPLGNQVNQQGQGPESYWSNQEYFATQHQVLMSRHVTSTVVRALGLNHDSGFLSMAPPGVRPPAQQVTVDVAAEVLQSRLTVKPITDSRLVKVFYSDADPERARRVLSSLIDSYVDQNLERTLDSAGKRAEWLDTQLDKLKTELESQEMDLHDFKKRTNLLSVSFDDQSNMLRAEIQQLNTTLTDLKSRQEKVAARLAVLQSINLEDPSAIPQTEILSNAALEPLRAAYITAQREVERLKAVGKGENHPEMQAALSNLRTSKDAVLNELKNARTGVAADLDAVHRELGGVTRLYEGAKSQAMELNLNEVHYGRLRRSKDNTEHMFGLVLERATESELSKLMPFNNVRVLDRPLMPGGPVSPRPLMNLAFGGALGLLLGLAGALGRELSDRTVRGPEDAEDQLGSPSLGSLPDLSARSGRNSLYYGAYYGRRGRKGSAKTSQPPQDNADFAPELIVQTHPKSAAAEAARAVRTNLVFMSPDRPYRSLLVTSAGPAEGKTTVAASIAIAMSQAGQRVCLVDCDLRRPRVHSIFGRSLEEGVTTALIDPSRLDAACFETMVPKLWIMPAGPTPPNPADLVHSDAFGRLLASLTDRFDRVVVDSPPACLVTDAVILSTRVDATVLVVRAKKTRRDAARRALRMIQDVGSRVTGIVTNAVGSQSEQYAYPYYRTYEQTPSEQEQA
ncbi:MAG TPA: polysaccharide biosynthesis tyrosine autokinase [Polyangiaceae bacterium]|nr:polysaccharide biosynthesis tyrosine autokinase [Polyangiaceae bacterium]